LHRNVRNIAIILIGILGVTGIILGLYNQSASLYWAIEPGTERIYLVRVTGFTDYWHNGSLSLPPYAELNNSLLTIRFNSFPEIGWFLDSVAFTRNILNYTKTMVVEPVEYVNGSEVVTGDYSFLNSVVSQSTLPVGNWPFIDSLYPDEPDMIYSCDTYLSSLGTSFMIGYRMYNIDAGHGWTAMVNMTTGLPINTTVWASEYYRDPWYSYEITLTLL